MPSRIFITWLPFALLATILCGLVYAVVQQEQRQSANDPQIQMAEDAAGAIASGFSPSAFVWNAHVDIAQSLAPFMIVYDDASRVISSSGKLNGSVPIPPSGVFEYAKSHPDDRLTWQPAPGVRLAAVVVRYEGATPSSSGYIIAARSLREVEERESYTQLVTGCAWIASLVITLLAVAYGQLAGRKTENI